MAPEASPNEPSPSVPGTEEWLGCELSILISCSAFGHLQKLGKVYNSWDSLGTLVTPYDCFSPVRSSPFLRRAD